MPESLSATVTDRDLLFALLGGAAAYLSVCVLIWPIVGCMARYSFRRGPRLTRIERMPRRWLRSGNRGS